MGRADWESALAKRSLIAPWLRVYYRITSFELELTQIDAGGVRNPVPLPDELSFSEYWNRTPDQLLPVIERGFRQAVEAGLLPRPSPGGRYELTVRYSPSSPARDQTVSWQAP